MNKYDEFLRIAALINSELGATPLLFGSLGLERRLGADLSADDIDVLLPERWLKSDWGALTAFMNRDGYALCDKAEHEFTKGGFKVAFAVIESLGPFAGVDISAVPVVSERGARYYLPALEDWLKVYTASSKDGYRRDVRGKKDGAKIELIRRALAEKG